MAEQKQINFTIVPDEDHVLPERIYANFCAIAHTPFDFTLTFCEVTPLSPRDIEHAEQEGVVKAPIKARIVAPVAFIAQLIGALQEHLRVYSESYGGTPPPAQQGPVH